MDPVSQAAVGAAFAQALARRGRAASAGLLGALAGMAPDLDALIRSSRDPLLFLEVHRQFTHSFVFVPIGALLCALVLHPLVRRRLSRRESYLYCLLGFATHGLLDACTSYGTQLLWPFSDLRVSWSHIAIVDPLFTLPLVVLCGLAARIDRRSLARVACAWAAGYLLLGVFQGERAESVGFALAHERGHQPDEVQAKPAFGSLLLWKTIYENEDRFHVDAVRLLASPRVFSGSSIERLSLARDLPWLDPGSQQARSLERFRGYSQDSLALDPNRAHTVFDVRYSMLPNRIEPLWGITLDPAADATSFPAFVTFRGLSPADRKAFLSMLFPDASGPR
jgi:inner membrane protein